MKKTDQSPLTKILIAVLAVAGAVLLVLMGVLYSTDNGNMQQGSETGGYIRIAEYTYKQTGAAATEYSFPVPATLERDSSLVFFAEHQSVHVYLDDTLVYSRTPAEEASFLKTTGSYWVWVPLFREDAGRQLRVVITSAYENISSQVTFLLGSEAEIFWDQLRLELPQLILSGLTVFLGFGFLCIAGGGLLLNKKRSVFWPLGIFAIVLGLWKFSATGLSSVIIGDKPAFLACLSSGMVMIGMLPLIGAVKNWYDKGDTQLLDWYSIGAALVCTVQVLLQLLGVMDLREMYPVTWCVVVAGILAMIGNGVYVRVKYPAKYRRFSQKDLAWILGAGVLGDATAYLVKGSNAGLMFTLISFLCYVIVAGVYNHAQQLRAQREKERMLEEKDQQLIQSRITTMMSQIRSHFVFNILNAISGMCKYDPEKADKTVVRFARYLRANIDIMQDDQPVTFRSDLRHVEDYVSLEQVRFGDQIRFVTDITVEQFMIPPLILQPIVENAIKHGLTPKPSGGTITLRTEKDDSNIRIIVRDDGVGFDPAIAPSDKSVGLKNVQLRLQYMMRGSLDIVSAPGQGTAVTISILREEAEQCG